MITFLYDFMITGDLSGETQAEKRQRIKEICERVRLGHYSLQGRKEDPTSPRWRKPTKHGSLLKAIVDHYHKVSVKEMTSPRWWNPTKHGSLLKAIVDHHHEVSVKDSTSLRWRNQTWQPTEGHSRPLS